MRKVLFALLLLASAGVFARDGFKVGADRTKFFTWFGGEALYQDGKDKIKCKYVETLKGVDDWGDAYQATGFSCKKHLYIVVKEFQDINKQLFILVDPSKFDERTAYEVDMFLEYKKEEK
ncbi:hypothetical protein nieznany_158 [Escherichia phage nieznany]|uniref:Uncharacterized protein n=1 Tax=Escherichia phage nieznany TaxID=2696432 RepID=A0A6B9X026_9CAUD|nr:hypothetical protein JR324_gp158 [Escherichia phage nieznany]QHR69491.1 hypothetical protein nieznany_158 [Escherichia phage nieznany]WPK38158.1 hypothetical protein [Escherichia phage AV126]